MTVAASKNQEIRKLLSSLLTQHATSSAGKVHLISLDDIATSYGDKWPRVRRHIMLGVENIISRNLGINDVFFEVEKDVFVLIFPSLDRDQAEVKVRQVVEQMERFLFMQERDGREIHVAAAVASLNEVEMPANGDIFNALLSTLLQTRHSVGRPAPATTPGEDPHYAQDINAATSVLKKLLRIDYQPIWDAESQMVFGFKLKPVRRSQQSPETVTADAEVLTGGVEDPLSPNLDLLAVDSGRRDIDIHANCFTAGGAPPMVIIPVSVATWISPRRELLERALRYLSQTAGRRRCGFLLRHFDDNVNKAMLKKILDDLLGIGAVVGASVHFEYQNIGVLRDNGCSYLHANYRAFSSIGFSSGIARRLVVEFTRGGAKLGFKTFLSGIDDVKAGEMALQSGCSWLAGKLVGEPVRTIEDSRKLRQSDLLKMSRF